MGSVKGLQLGPNTLGGRHYRPPAPHNLGFGVWQVSGAFSVADLKHLLPRQEIAGKNFGLAMTAGAYWEAAANAGFRSTYAGMIDADGNITDVATLLGRGEMSDLVAMELACTPETVDGKVTGGPDGTLAEYHARITKAQITTYVMDGESIWRGGFPLGSSTFEKIFKAAGMSAGYADLATYDALVEGLDEVRGISGVMDLAEMQQVLAAAGLDCIPNPGHLLGLGEEVVGFTTKFDPAGDKGLTYSEAMASMHMCTTSFEAWCHTLRRNARHQREYCLERNVVNFDGKTEAISHRGKPVMADFACTIDENRLMLRYTLPGGQVVYVPANKEIQRAIFRRHGIYTAIGRARDKYGDDWSQHFFEFVTQRRLEEVAAEAVWMMEQAIATICNRLLGVNVFDADPIDNWVTPFLPYASYEQAA